MRKLNYFFLGAAGLMLASCSQENELNTVTGKDSTAHFTVKLPKDFNTREIGDGTEAKNLCVLLYNTTSGTPVFVDDQWFTFEDGDTQEIAFDLLTNNSYKLAFFAASPTALPENSTSDDDVFSINTTNGTLTVNYANMTSEGNIADAYDCFYAKYDTGTVGSTPINETINLTRPVAQVNWGTTNINTDVFGTDGAYIQTTFTATNVPNQLNLIEGITSGNASVELENFASPSTADADFPEVGTTSYQYVALQYLLAPTTSTTIDMSLNITNKGYGDATAPTESYENTIKVSSAPIQANYQTNVYGSLLSSNATFNVVKQPGTWGGSYDLTTWDGSTVTAPTIDESTKTVSINRASDLAGLAAMVNGGEINGETQTANDFNDYTISLAADFDMGSNEFPMIGSAGRSSGNLTSGTKSFKGTFDGQNHTISNVKITGTSTSSDAVGVFPSIDGASTVIKDVTFDNIQINASNNDQAGVIGLVSNGATVSNVNVTSGEITGNQGTGGIVGRVLANGTVTGCKNGATVKTVSYNCGGIVGAAYYTAQGTSMTVSECENTGDVSGTYAVAGIVGLSCADVSGCTNTGNVVGTAASVGGVVGEQKSAGSIKNCTNSGTVQGGSSSTYYGAGGIVGWVRYENSTSYARQNIIVVSGCTNTASVTGATGVGGIVGVWYQCGECYSNTNEAPSLTGVGSFVAGIVGDSQWLGNVPNQLGDAPYQNNLFVQNNYSNTQESSMTGSLSVPFVYINDGNKTFASGNSMDDTNVVNNTFTPATTTSGNSWSDWNQ